MDHEEDSQWICSGSGMTRTSFFVVFVGNCQETDLLSVGKAGLSLFRECFFMQFVAFNESSSQPTSDHPIS